MSALVISQNFRLGVAIHEAGAIAGGPDSTAVYFTVGEDGILRLGMKRIGCVLRVRLKTEQLSPAFGPRAAFGAGIPIDVQRFGGDRKISESVKDRTILVDLHALQNVGMMAHHDVGSRIDSCFGDLPFVHANGRRSVPEAFVQGNHQSVCFLAEGLNIGRHSLERMRFGKRVYRGGTARGCMVKFVMRQDVYIRATSSISSGPGPARSYTVVTEKS